MALRFFLSITSLLIVLEKKKILIGYLSQPYLSLINFNLNISYCLFVIENIIKSKSLNLLAGMNILCSSFSDDLFSIKSKILLKLFIGVAKFSSLNYGSLNKKMH